MVRLNVNGQLRITTMLMTMFDGRTRLAQDVVDDVRRRFPDLTLKTLIPRSVRLSEAPSQDQTVLNYDPDSVGALAYIAAASELANRGAYVSQ
jgi:chromosome partitioning protein